MKKQKKDSKIKIFYSNFKEAWKDPRKKAGIKLLSYFLFFVILFLLAAITSNMNKYNSIEDSNITTTTKLKEDKYNDKLNNLLENKYDINYVIKKDNVEYKINGNIENNVIIGYLELSNEIKKIVFKDNNFYEIKNNEEILLEVEIDAYLLNLSNLINLIRENSPIKNNEDNNNNIYSYSFKYNNIDLNVIVSFNEEIYNIVILYNGIEYNLSFDN